MTLPLQHPESAPEVRNQAGVVTSSVAVAAATRILNTTNISSLLEYGGYINPTKEWPYHFLAK